MENKNLVIIFSHCDDDNKRKILDDNIQVIKDNGFDILLVSHIPIHHKVVQKVDYFVYDKSNPLLFWPERGMCHWKTVYLKEEAYRMDTIFPDTGWTVFNQMLISGNLGLSLDYSHYTFVNYDIRFTQSILDAMRDPEDCYASRVVVTNDWNGEGEETRKTFFPGLVFNILSKDNLSKLIPLISKENYINGYGGDDIAFDNVDDFSHSEIKRSKYHDVENYYFNLISNFPYRIHPELVEEKCGFKPVGERGIEPFNFNTHTRAFKINIDENTDNFIIYDVDGHINFNINGETINIHDNYFIDNKKIGGITSLGFYDLQNELVDLLLKVEGLKKSTVTRTIRKK